MIRNFRTIIFILISIISSTAYTQSNTNSSFDGNKLIGKKWYFTEVVNGVRETRTMIFDKDSVTEVIVIGNRTIIQRDAYYLHDQPSMDFHPGYIGKSTKGKYFYRRAEEGKDIGFIVHKLTNDEFIYSFYKNSPHIKFTAYPLDHR